MPRAPRASAAPAALRPDRARGRRARLRGHLHASDHGVERPAGRDIALTFRAPGDDWLSGEAKGYEVLRSKRPLRDGHWRGVVRSQPAMKPGAPGAAERIVVRAPRSGRRYYAVRAFDAAGNMGAACRSAAASGRPAERRRTVGVRPTSCHGGLGKHTAAAHPAAACCAAT